MLFLDGQPFKPMRMDKAGEGGAGSGGGAGGGTGDPGPGDKGGKKAPGGNDPGGKGEPDPDPADPDNWTPEQTKAYIKKLRKENASYRTRAQDSEGKITKLEDRFGKLEGGLKVLAGGDPDKKETVEEKIDRLEKSLEDRNAADDQQQAINEMNAAVQETATALGVPADGLDYFRYLIQQEAEKLNDDDAIPEETLKSLAEQAKKTFPTKGISTGADGKDGSKPKPEGKPQGVKVEQFAKMTIAERSALYQNNKDEYESLMSEAKTKRLLFT